mgnify:CR=1 FL=1
MTKEIVGPFDVALLFRKHSVDLHRFMKSRGFADDAAADVSQEAFLRLLTSSQTEGIRNHKGYLFRIAANLGVDIQRRQAREGRVESIDETGLEIVDDSPSVERIIISRQELALLAKAFDEVPSGPQRVFLARLEGLTFAEIERRLGVPLKTAFSQVMKVTLFLKSRLDDAQEIRKSPSENPQG